MKCIIPGSNVKVFGRAIHSLHKIGDELYIEALVNGLALRTVNSSRSAFTSFIFAPSFFITYSQLSDNDGQSEALKCKISLKSCVTVFKSLTTLEKTVEKCKITLLPDEDRLIFQLYCHHGIVKTHRLRFMECDSLQAVYSKQLCPNVLVCQTRLLSDAVMNFQQGQEEITLIATPVKLVLKNHVDDLDPDANKAVRTELCLSPDEFDSYTIGVDTEITFCLKELRAAIFFSEASNLPISLHFESPGKPVVFAISGDVTFEANLVLATLASDVTTSSQSGTSSQMATPGGSISNSLMTSAIQRPIYRPNNKSTARSNNKAVSLPPSRCPPSTDRTVNDDLYMMETFDIQNNTTVVDTTGIGQTEGILNQSNNTTVVKTTGIGQSEGILNQSNNTTVVDTTDVMNNTNNASFIDINDGMRNESSSYQNDLVDGCATDGEQTKTKSRLFDLVGLDSPAMRPNEESGDSDEVNEAEDNFIPGTPPSKKFKSLFFGLSQSTTSGSQLVIQSRPNILAEDSEED